MRTAVSWAKRRQEKRVARWPEIEAKGMLRFSFPYMALGAVWGAICGGATYSLSSDDGISLRAVPSQVVIMACYLGLFGLWLSRASWTNLRGLYAVRVGNITTIEFATRAAKQHERELSLTLAAVVIAFAFAIAWLAGSMAARSDSPALWFVSVLSAAIGLGFLWSFARALRASQPE